MSGSFFLFQNYFQVAGEGGKKGIQGLNGSRVSFQPPPPAILFLQVIDDQGYAGTICY